MADRPRRDGEVRLSLALRRGTEPWDKPGWVAGYLIRRVHGWQDKHVSAPMWAVGPVMIGPQRYLLVVTHGEQRWWLCDGAKMFSWRGAYPDSRTASPEGLEGAALLAWGDSYLRAFVDQTAPTLAGVVEDAVAGYHALVRARVEACILGLARDNIERTVDDVARSVSSEWGELELLRPPRPSLMHALLVSLVLALDVDAAAELIETGALLEYRVPLLDRGATATVYARARRLLATLMPAWWTQGAATPWLSVGATLSGVLGAQWRRIVDDSAARGVPLTVAAGVAGAGMPPDDGVVGGLEPT